MTLRDLTIAEAKNGLRSRAFSCLDLAKAAFSRIAETDGQVHALLQTLEEQAMKDAEASDRRYAAGEARPLEGIPVVLKDNLLLRGSRATSGSRILEGYESPYDATAASRLREAGAVVIAKSNMDEFAMGSSTENSAYGPTRNPWNLGKVPGGSSGGSAAAVAAGMCLGALGSDTGGSIRQPAAMCGVTGFKPTYGRVSRYGLMSMASSLDQIGPFGRTVADVGALLEAIEGEDPLDSTSAPRSRYRPSSLPKEGLKGVRLGLPKEWFVAGMDDEVRSRVMEAVAGLEKLGAEPVEVSLPSSKYALSVYYVLMPCEVSANLARYDGMRFGLSAPAETLRETYFQTRAQGFGKEVRRRVLLGTHALSSGYYDAYYLQAQKVRTVMRQEFEAAMRDVDAIVSPTSPAPAWDLGEKLEDPLSMYLSDIYTVTANVIGAPGISVPCGFARDLPVGLQILGRPFEDDTVLDLASRYQAATSWHLKRPVL